MISALCTVYTEYYFQLVIKLIQPSITELC